MAILRARAAVGHRSALRALRDLADTPETSRRSAPEPAEEPVQVPIRTSRWTGSALAVVPAVLLLALDAFGVVTGRVPLETLSVAVAALILAYGELQLRMRPDFDSWRTHAVGLIVLFVPSLILTFAGGDAPVRRVLLLTVALAVAATGIVRRLSAPAVLGAATFIVAGEHELVDPGTSVIDVVVSNLGLLLLVFSKFRTTSRIVIKALSQMR